MFKRVCLAALLSLLPLDSVAEESVSCLYTDNRGVIKVADDPLKIPAEYRAAARCSKSRSNAPARPNEIELTGNIRSVSMASPVGRIELRWPRALEKLFGRTPERALADAARTASKAVKSGGFPGHVATVDLSWRIVFLDQNLPERQIPQQLVTQCHPGWMYPPADVFIVGQRIVGGCANGTPLDSQNADRALTRVLLHEMGHAIEFALMHGDKRGWTDRFRSEAFASWFEDYAAGFSAVADQRAVSADYASLGQAALNQGMSGLSFSGSPLDYGLGYLGMHVLVERRGVAGLVRFYEKKAFSGEPFFLALRQELSLNPEKFRNNLAEMAERLRTPGKRR